MTTADIKSLITTIAKHMSRESIADSIGTIPKRLRKYERGELYPTPRELDKLQALANQIRSQACQK